MNKQGLKSIWLLIALALLAPASMTLADSGALNANSASPKELAGLPHLDEVLAEIIVDNRPFVTIGELHDLRGADLDGNRLEELYPRLFVPIKLNVAKRSDILLIPGVGGRMAHEFKEYGPDSNIERFRREIGKYVDEVEIARLDQYVLLD